MTEQNFSSTLGDSSQKGFKKCPYCANDINVDAIKCQYCGEFLNNGNTKGKKIRYKNIWLWMFLLIVICIMGFLFTNLGKQIRTNLLVNKFSKNLENVKTFDEIKDDLNNIKTTSTEEESLVNEMGEIIEKFSGKLQTFDSSYLYLETTDYKNKNLIKKCIDARKQFDTFFIEYISDIDALLTKYKDLDDTGTGKYSLNGMLNEIKKVSNSITSYKDKVVSFYNYILSIQDDFYVESDGQVYFYDGGSKMDKYNKLSSEEYDSLVKFFEDYNNFINYMDGYNKYWNLN